MGGWRTEGQQLAMRPRLSRQQRPTADHEPDDHRLAASRRTAWGLGFPAGAVLTALPSSRLAFIIAARGGCVKLFTTLIVP